MGAGKDQKLIRRWNRQAESYDRQMRFLERRLFGKCRVWLGAQATGDVLEVAIGTGLNLPHYPPAVRLTGIEWSPAMLDIARSRARQLGRTVNLQVADAQALPFGNAAFDTVVCTLGLCTIPDDRRALVEMVRVLRPGGRLLLLDHVVSTAWLVRLAQWLLERVTVPLGGEHFRRRPLPHVLAQGLQLEHHQRVKLGTVEWLAARKPPGPAGIVASRDWAASAAPRSSGPERT